MNQLEELQNIQKKISTMKSEKDQLKGRESSILESLKKEFKVSDVDAAESSLLALKKKSSKLLEQFNAKLLKLKEDYGW